MNIQDIKEKGMLMLECISGSRAYGLSNPQSDTDLKGVFVLPKRMYYGLENVEQINNDTNDEVYYELKRFVDLLVKNNPNILELLNTPFDCIRFRNPILDLLKPEIFLSKLCKNTFAGYAMSQVKKARGLNKKIINPVDKERKSVLDYCYVINQKRSITLKAWLKDKGFEQAHCGLVAIDHMREVYALFHNSQLSKGYLRGIYSGTDANDILLSSVEPNVEPMGIMSFNKDGYSQYCKDYKEYWEWVEKRNEIRFENTLEHGKNYDAKNMMHTFRLLNMSEEIAREGKVNVRRHDRDFLLKIRSGFFSYEELVQLANEKVWMMNALYDKSSLPEMPDAEMASDLLAEMREMLYA